MLGQVIGDLLAPAVGIALSPVPIVAVILMLLSARARVTASAFAAGWSVGIAVVSVVVMLLVPASAASGTGSAGSVVGVVKLLLGALFLFLAVKNWRSRPKAGGESAPPKWMSSIDRMGAGAALGLGAALSALNPKNLPLALAAGLSLAGLSSPGPQIVGAVIFVLLAASTVLGPVVVYLLASSAVAAPLAELKEWLSANNATIMATVLTVLGAVMVGKGIAGLS